VAFAANSDLCLSFLRLCVAYGERVFTWCLPSIVSPTSLRAMAPHDLWERTIRLRSEVTGISVENAATVQGLSSYYLKRFDGFHRHKCSLGSRKFKDAYNKAMSLEQKMSSGLNTLLGELLSWVTVADGQGLPDVLPDVLTVEQVRELSYVWAKARDSARAALLDLTSEPASRLFYRSALLSSTRPRSVMTRWMMHK
jgi:hypothetical protein